MNEERGEIRGKVLLRLYVADDSPASTVARRQLDELLEEIDGEIYDVEVIDVVEHPERAEEARVLATPTLVRVRPGRLRSIIGDLSDRRMVVAVLGLGRAEKDRGDSDA